MLKMFKVIKAFQSPLVGDKAVGDVFPFGEDAALRLIELGCIEPYTPENKDGAIDKKQSKKAAKK